MTRLRAALRGWLPVAVSIAILAWLLARDDIDLHGVGASLSLRSAGILAAALLAYGALTLVLEALSLARMLATPAGSLSVWTAARLKAASYLAYTLHYTIGAGALAVLLRQRAGGGLADAAGVVLLIAAFDLALTLGVASVGAFALGTDTPAVRAGVIAAAGLGVVGGLAVLRAPASLGRLDSLRSLALFRTARTALPAHLAELAALRLVFVLCFVGVVGAALLAFEVRVPVPHLLVSVALLALIAALPIAVAGLGTGQAAFVYLFREYGDPPALLACSLALSAGLIVLRAGLGVLFAREYAREAVDAMRRGQA